MTTSRFNTGECEGIVRRMWPHLDGVLSAEERTMVSRHLEECGNCRSHFEFAKSFLDAVRHAKADSGDADMDAVRRRVVAALTAEGFQES